jgi:hypothetical protein
VKFEGRYFWLYSRMPPRWGQPRQEAERRPLGFRSGGVAQQQFGANISGNTGMVLVEGTVAANLKVVLKW